MNTTRVRYLQAIIPIRYPEDATVNGEVDETGELLPLQHINNRKWDITIDLRNGKIHEWPIGTTADVHFKVVDEGCYYLLDEDGNEVARRIKDYVPSKLLANGEGWGDYVILTIGKDGQIDDWVANPIDVNDWQITDDEQDL